MLSFTLVKALEHGTRNPKGFFLPDELTFYYRKEEFTTAYAGIFQSLYALSSARERDFDLSIQSGKCSGTAMKLTKKSFKRVPTSVTVAGELKG